MSAPDTPVGNEAVESSESTVDSDAREFGQHFRQGGWRLGLLVARNVKPGKAGRPANRPRVDNFESEQDSSSESEDGENRGKVSISEFAAKAGVSKQHVANHYNAWELAADDGVCQHAEDLLPGDDDARIDFEEDDALTQELWSMYLQKAKVPKEPKEPKASGSHRGNAGAKEGKGSKGKTPQDQLLSAMEQVSCDTERLSEHLGTLVRNVSLGTKAVFPGLAQDVRAQLDVLEKGCDLMHQVLDFIGYGEAEDEDVENGDEPEDVPLEEADPSA